MNGEGKYQKGTDARRHPYICQIQKQSLQPDHSTPLHRQTQDTPTQGCSRDTAEQGIDGKTPDHINHSCLNTRQIQNNTEHSQKKRLHESAQTGKGNRRHRQKSKSHPWQHRPSSSDSPKQKRKLRKKETEGNRQHGPKPTCRSLTKQTKHQNQYLINVK